jgi:hypothetical protein
LHRNAAIISEWSYTFTQDRLAALQRNAETAKQFTIAVQINILHCVSDFVILAQAEIQCYSVRTCKFHRTRACAGVTEGGG